MKKRIILSLLVLAVLIPAEAYAWHTWISPMFWAPGVAYTQLGWGYVFLGLLFIFMPIAAIGSIWEKD